MKLLVALSFFLLSLYSVSAQTAAIDSLASIVDSMYENAFFREAIPIAQKLVEQSRKEFGENDITYANDVGYLATLYLQAGSYDTAIKLNLQYLQIIKEAIGEKNIDYITALNNLAYVYEETGRFDLALPLLEQSCLIARDINEEYYVVALINLGELYGNLGYYDKALSVYKRAQSILQNLNKKNTSNYAIVLNNMATLYSEVGNYEQALPLYQQSLQTLKDTFGEHHPTYATFLNNLSGIYQDISDYEKALPLYRQALQIMKEVYGEKSRYYALLLNNLGSIYLAMNQFTVALPLYEGAFKIIEESIGEDDPLFIIGLINIATTYHNMGNYEKALPILQQAMQLTKEKYGERHQQYAHCLYLLADLYKIMLNSDKALPLYLESIQVYKEVYGTQHPSYANALMKLSNFYEDTKCYDKALPLFRESEEITLKQLTEGSKYLGQDALIRVVNANHTKIDMGNSLSFTSQSSLLNQSNLQTDLLLKGITLQNGQDLATVMNTNNDSGLAELISDLKQTQNQLTKLYKANAPTKQIDSLTAIFDVREQKLMQRSEKYQQMVAERNVGLPQIQQALQDNEAAIEFVHFQYWNKKWTDSVLYAAYIFRREDTMPVFVPLFEEKQLEQLLASAGIDAKNIAEQLYRGVTVTSTAVQSSKGSELYNLLWKPLLPYLQNVKKIVYSPAGKLYSIAFHALVNDSNVSLMEQYQLQQYATLRQVAHRSQNIAIKPSSIQLFGDPDFSSNKTLLATTTQTNTAVAQLYTPDTRSSTRSGWNALSGTAYEVKQISKLFSKNKLSTQTFIQTAASEENLKALSGKSPQILHIATHGFFLPQEEQKHTDNSFGGQQNNSMPLSKNPLMRSGLVFSGANRVWSGKEPIEGMEDGIATAYEISQLDLSNTALIVLSACETALGDIKGNEGVFGLQRAFKMAGVKNMIVSLWQVPDKETAELMTDFYRYWINGATISDAFTKAQSNMRKKYTPFYWAAFVLVQ